MHGFLPGGGLTPAEPAHPLGILGQRFPAPKLDRAFRRRRVPRRPIYRARLLFDHPPAPLPAGAIQAVMKRRQVRMAGAQVSRLVRRSERPLPQKADRIAIPRRRIQLPADGEMIEFGEQAHEIVDNVPPRRRRAQDDHLRRVEAFDHRRGKTLPILPMRRVAFGDGAERRIDLGKAAIFLRPERQPPRRVQRLHIAIPRRQPVPERRLGRIGCAHHRVVAAIFIVGLPGDDGRVLAVPRGHQGRDALGLFQINI